MWNFVELVNLHPSLVNHGHRTGFCCYDPTGGTGRVANAGRVPQLSYPFLPIFRSKRPQCGDLKLQSFGHEYLRCSQYNISHSHGL